MEEQKIVRKLSVVGILGNILLAGFKLFSGIFGHSGAMISDAVHSLSDVLATMIAYIGVILSKRPQDKNHPYGHERLECVASLILGLILAGTGLGIGYTGMYKIISPEELRTPTLLPLIAAVVSILVKEGMFWYTMHYARTINSTAFKADAWHHRSDALSSVGSFVGILLAKSGFPIMDPIASLIISLLIIKVAVDIANEALNKMLDTSCGSIFEDDLREFIKIQPGVENIDLLRTRQFGNRIYIDLEIAVNKDSTLIFAHNVAENVHAAVEKQYPNVKHIMIHVNPYQNPSDKH